MCGLHRGKATNLRRRERFVDLTEGEVRIGLRICFATGKILRTSAILLWTNRTSFAIIWGYYHPRHSTRRSTMKYRRSEVRSTARALPQLRFEDQTLTSSAGLVLFQKFFASIDLKSRRHRCFEPRRPGKAFPPATAFLPLIVHLLLGFRELQDGRYDRDDPLVQRLLGLRRLPTVASAMFCLPLRAAWTI